ncbi:MAG: TetR family transcriptional regulator [Rhodobacteraceae bacterium]|nr:TetR family transcriptional regulator [Paracoccaceae bacterium]
MATKTPPPPSGAAADASDPASGAGGEGRFGCAFSRRRNRYHHGDLAQALVTAVRTLVERDGVEKLSISGACRMAGVSSAAPYKHFRDRADILRALCREGFGELREAMATAAAAIPAPGPDRLAALGKAYLAYAEANPGLFGVMFGMKRELHDPEDTRTHEIAHANMLIVIAEVGAALGEDPPGEEAHRLACVLWTFVHGAATLTLDGDYEAAGVEVDTHAMIDLAAHRLVPAG